MTPTSWSYRFFVGKIPHLKYFHKEICFRKKKTKKIWRKSLFFPQFLFLFSLFLLAYKRKRVVIYFMYLFLCTYFWFRKKSQSIICVTCLERERVNK